MSEIELHEEKCEVCGETVWWDDEPNPICDPCSTVRLAAEVERLKEENERLTKERDEDREAIRAVIGYLPRHWLKMSSAREWLEIPAVRRALAARGDKT